MSIGNLFRRSVELPPYVRRSHSRFSRVGTPAAPVNARSLAAAGWHVTDDDGKCFASIAGANGIAFLLNVATMRMIMETPEGFVDVVRTPRLMAEMKCLMRALLALD